MMCVFNFLYSLGVVLISFCGELEAVKKNPFISGMVGGLIFVSESVLASHLRRPGETNLFSIYISVGETLTWPWKKQNKVVGGRTYLQPHLDGNMHADTCKWIKDSLIGLEDANFELILNHFWSVPLKMIRASVHRLILALVMRFARSRRKAVTFLFTGWFPL